MHTDSALEHGRLEPWSRRFVWLLWVGTAGILAYYVISFGADHPLWDEWQNVPYLTGDVATTWSNLCIPAGWGHRVPLLRLLLIGLARLTHFNFRAPLLLTVGLLCVQAAMMFRVCERIRGRAAMSDAFIVLCCLNFGTWENLLQGWNLQNILFSFFASVLLACIVRQPAASLPGLLTMAACLIVMPWATGMAGLVLASIMAAFWLLGIVQSLAAHPQMPVPFCPRKGTRYLVLLLLAAVVFGAWQHQRGITMSPVAAADWSKAVQGAAIFLGTPIVSNGSGPARWLFFSITFLQLGSVVLLCLLIWRSEGATFRAMGLVMFVAAMALLAFGIGWARSGLGPDYCHSSRYVALATPFALATYLLAVVAGNRSGRAIEWFMLLTLIGFTPSKMRTAVEAGEQHKGRSTVFDRDVRAGMSIEKLAARHRWLNPSLDQGEYYEFHKEQMISALKVMQQHAIGPFARPSGSATRP